MVVREQGFRPVVELWEGASDVYASRLTYVESLAAVAARSRVSVRGRRQFAAARRNLIERWHDVSVVDLNEYVAEVAGLAAVQHRLRGADAIHFASAAVLGSGITMVTRDLTLRRAALAVGIDVAP